MDDNEHHEPCNCPACRMGLFCKDGQRGQFVRGVDECARCGILAWRHSNKGKKFTMTRSK